MPKKIAVVGLAAKAEVGYSETSSLVTKTCNILKCISPYGKWFIMRSNADYFSMETIGFQRN